MNNLYTNPTLNPPQMFLPSTPCDFVPLQKNALENYVYPSYADVSPVLNAQTPMQDVNQFSISPSPMRISPSPTRSDFMVQQPMVMMTQPFIIPQFVYPNLNMQQQVFVQEIDAPVDLQQPIFNKVASTFTDCDSDVSSESVGRAAFGLQLTLPIWLSQMNEKERKLFFEACINAAYQNEVSADDLMAFIASEYGLTQAQAYEAFFVLQQFGVVPCDEDLAEKYLDLKYAYVDAVGEHKGYNDEAVAQIMKNENLSQHEAKALGGYMETYFSILWLRGERIQKNLKNYAKFAQKTTTDLVSILNLINQAEDEEMFMEWMIEMENESIVNVYESLFSRLYNWLKEVEMFVDMIQSLHPEEDINGKKQRLIERVEAIAMLFTSPIRISNEELRGEEILMLPCTNNRRLLTYLIAVSNVSMVYPIKHVAFRNSSKSGTQRKGYTCYFKLHNDADLEDARKMFVEDFGLKRITRRVHKKKEDKRNRQ